MANYQGWFGLGLISFVSLLVAAQGMNNGVGRTPAMGWNNYNFFGCDINQEIIMQTADALVSTGLAAAGYKYVCVDDCWADWGGRDNQGKLTPSGKFSNGMKALGDYIHKKGLKYGIYADAGTMHCSNTPESGSLNREELDMRTFAEWGVDYVKVDNCNNNDIPPQERYKKIGQAAQKAQQTTGRAMFIAMCEWGGSQPATWAQPIAHSWRTQGDIKPEWPIIMRNLDSNDRWADYAGPGGWNDPDMLEVGNPGITLTESRTHFSLWALIKAPLLLGNDIRNMKPEVLDILENREVIAVNQDRLGVQGKKVKKDGDKEVWAGPLDGDAFVVILFNRGGGSVSITATWADIGIPNGATMTVRDLWKHANIGQASGSISASNIPSHGCVMYVLHRGGWGGGGNTVGGGTPSVKPRPKPTPKPWPKPATGGGGGRSRYLARMVKIEGQPNLFLRIISKWKASNKRGGGYEISVSVRLRRPRQSKNRCISTATISNVGIFLPNRCGVRVRREGGTKLSRSPSFGAGIYAFLTDIGRRGPRCSHSSSMSYKGGNPPRQAMLWVKVEYPTKKFVWVRAPSFQPQCNGKR